MKRALLAMAVMTVLSGCGSLGLGGGQSRIDQPTDAKTPVKDVKVSTDFADQGIKIYYTLLGDLDRIEVYGVAPAWKGNYDIVAELDAKQKLIKFMRGETVSNESRINVITKTLDRARDNTMNRFQGENDTMEFKASDLEDGTSTTNPKKDFKDEDNVSRRTAQRVENSVITTVTKLTSSGRLTGVRKIREGIRDNGRVYVAVYQWSEKDQAAADFIRNRMK